jgi:anthranilate phosphoribosyltransferase
MLIPKTEWLLAAPTAATGSRADTPLYPFLNRLVRGEDLSFDEAADFFRILTDRNTYPQQIAGALVALTAKGETFSELAGMARVLREQAVSVKTHHKNFIDTSGTGSSKAKTFNVSTAAAFVAAGAGLMVAKQTNRAVASNTGSAEVLGKLGVKVSSQPEIAEACLNGAGICFMFAPKFHPTLKRVGLIRGNLGIRSCLNLLGVLSNPANAPKQIVGVWHRSLIEPIAQALALLGTENAWVVHGADGLDEISLAGETLVAEVFRNKLRFFKVTPEDFGLQRASIDHLKTDSAETSAKIISEVLANKRRDEARSLIILNAAAALIVGGITDEPIHAARLAEQSIDSHSAQVKLERLIKTTNKK